MPKKSKARYVAVYQPDQQQFLYGMHEMKKLLLV
jgi:hypothetical protein